MIVLLDSGGSNIGSVTYALDRLNVKSTLSSDPEIINAASHVILPGVGAAGPGMSMLRHKGLVECIQALKQPTLGVCLGMQLLYERSDEANTDCLGIVPGNVQHFSPSPGISIPHMGWNTLELAQENELLRGLDGQYFYFVHSYFAPINDATLATCEHAEKFCAVAQKDNFFACQFHPEKSAAAGAKLLQNFLNL